MALLCSLSSEPCVEPVATKNGDVYERRLIEKHIATTGVDPVTKQPISVSDLIPLKVVPSASVMRPKTATQQGIPAMLQGFQAEWDALMLEVFTLKQQLTSAQQELSNAMYQQDAAQRVIVRLMKENQHYKNELSAVRGASSSENGMDVDHESSASSSSKSVLPDAMVKRIAAKMAELSSMRETRQIGPTVATRAEVPAYTSLSQQSPHKTGLVHALDVVFCGQGGASGEALAVSGGADKTVVVLDQSSGKKLATLSAGFKKTVSAVKAINLGATIRVVASSEDGNVAVWDSASNPPTAFEHTCTVHVGASAIHSVDVHPIGDLVLVGLANGTFSMIDIQSQTCFASLPHAKLTSASIADAKFHPDGEIFATASDDGVINVWSVTTFAHMASFEGHSASITAICFSENGYSFASVAQDQTLRVWDLQELGQVQITQLGAKPTALAYDLSGRFLIVAVSPAHAKSSRELRVFTGRKCELVANFELKDAKDVHAVRWGSNAKSIIFAQDKAVHFWGPAAQ